MTIVTTTDGIKLQVSHIAWCKGFTRTLGLGDKPKIPYPSPHGGLSYVRTSFADYEKALKKWKEQAEKLPKATRYTVSCGGKEFELEDDPFILENEL